MNDYRQIRIDITPCSETATDLMAAFLSDIGYESFVPDESGLLAYIIDGDYDSEALQEVVAQFPMDVKISVADEFIEGKDWNEEWEKNYFQPIVIGNECVIHSTFHKDVPKATYDIVIDPKMAFGTGHHATTSLLLQYLLTLPLEGVSMIDMGTGTGILAILAKMRGAARAVGIEIDPAAHANAIENVALNHVDVELVLGDASALKELPEADLFIANINRNIILADMEAYAQKLHIESQILLSGFYLSDIPLVEKRAAMLGLKLIETKSISEDPENCDSQQWCAIRLIKEK